MATPGSSGATSPGKNGPIAFTEGLYANSPVFTIGPQRGDVEPIPYGPQQAGQPDISPDGSRVAYVGPDHNIYAKSIHGSGATPKQLTFADSNHSPTFTPDGKSIIYLHEVTVPAPPKGEVETELREIPVSGGEGTTIVTVPLFTWNTDISPNGKKIVFVGPGIFILNRDGSGMKNIAPTGADPSFSPTGKELAFAMGAGLNSQIATMRPDGSDKVFLTSMPAGAGSPVYSPDGTKIVFSSEAAGHSDIMIMNSDGTQPETLLATGVDVFAWAWMRSKPFSFGKLRRSGRRLAVRLFVPGRVTITGHGVKKTSGRYGRGRQLVPLKKKHWLKRRIANRGKARIRLSVQFKPDGALPSKLTRSVKLNK